MTNPLTVVVIGGGAAGFFGAITCATAHPHTRVTLLEAGRKPLGKVRISGGGRCNVTHHCFDPVQLVQHYPRGGKSLRGAFTRFQPKDTVAWFESQGIHLKTEADGRMFPVTDNSETIVNCLLEAAAIAGVKLRTGVPVKSVRQIQDFPLTKERMGGQGDKGDKGTRGQGDKEKFFHEKIGFSSSASSAHLNLKSKKPILERELKERFEIELKNGEVLRCDRVLVATGSNPLGYRWAKDLGHKIEPPVPSLFTFNIADPRLQGLAGISVENVCVSLPEIGKTKLEQTGPLLITHWGVSGPAVLKLSAWGARILHEHRYQMPLLINWVPQYNRETLRQYLLEIKSQIPKRKISGYCPLPLSKRLWQRLVTLMGINAQTPWAELSKKFLNKLVQDLSQGKYLIQGKGVFKEEFVTCGGISLKEINFKTMESKCCPGLYFAGEILDIDGVTGGFNFQSAWTTSWLAGQAMGNNEQ